MKSKELHLNDENNEKGMQITAGNGYARTNRTPDEESELYDSFNARLVKCLPRLPRVFLVSLDFKLVSAL